MNLPKCGGPNKQTGFSLKGWEFSAQGNALGCRRFFFQPEGLGQEREPPVVPALQAGISRSSFPGRCPGLRTASPSG